MPDARPDIDRLLMNAWCALLAVSHVAATDNFLDLGGNSLRAGQLAARLRTDLGIEVPIDLILAEETFASLAEAVKQLWVEAGEPAIAGETV